MATQVPIRLLIVDDSAFMRKAISSMIDPEGDIEIVGVAKNGLECVAMSKELQPDVITLDIEMPEMDGLTALRQLKKFCSSRIIMVSSLTTEGSTAALRAMSIGADDFISKNASQVSFDVLKIKTELLARIRALGHNQADRKTHPVDASESPTETPKIKSRDIDVVLIGSSTGGPPVLEQILTALPATFPLPIVVAQHMPPVFTKSMAARIDALAAVHVVEATHGEVLIPGTAYVGEGGRHIRIARDASRKLSVVVSDEPADALYKPSVDELFASAANVVGSRALAIVLTGMGRDGFEGGTELASKKSTVIAQDHESCIVYGMPKAVTESGVASFSMNPTQIATFLAGLGNNLEQHAA